MTTADTGVDNQLGLIIVLGGSAPPRKTSFKEITGHLSFDAYEQDQYFSIDAGQSGDRTSQSLTLVDRPDYPIGDLIAVTDRVRNLPPDQQKAELAKFTDAHPAPHQRL